MEVKGEVTREAPAEKTGQRQKKEEPVQLYNEIIDTIKHIISDMDKQELVVSLNLSANNRPTILAGYVGVAVIYSVGRPQINKQAKISINGGRPSGVLREGLRTFL